MRRSSISRREVEERGGLVVMGDGLMGAGIRQSGDVFTTSDSEKDKSVKQDVKVN